MPCARLVRSALAITVAGTLAGCSTAVVGAAQLDPDVSSRAPASWLDSTTSTPPESPTTTTPSAIRPMPPLSSDDPTPTGSGSPDTDSTSTNPTGTDGDFDAAAIADDLAIAHLVTIDSGADKNRLRKVVDGARAAGLKLAAVSIGTDVDDAVTNRLLDALYDRLAGTVIVLSPSLVTARSDVLTGAQRDAAVRTAADESDDVDALTAFVDAALADIGAAPTSTAAPQTVGGIDVAALTSAFDKNHVAISPGLDDVDTQGITATVRDGRKAGLELSVALLSRDSQGPLSAVATAVMRRIGGTVLLISPKRYALASESIADSQLQKALGATAKATTVVEVIDAVVKQLTD